MGKYLFLKLRYVCFLLVLIAMSGCASKKTGAPGEEVGPALPEEHGVALPPEVPQGPTLDGSSSQTGNLPDQNYVLILGPGLARTYAFLGVIRELTANKIPIKAVVGVEMGAVIGAIWLSSNLNNLEWEMHKLKRETLLDVPFLGLRGKVAEGKKIWKFLKEAIRTDELKSFQTPFYVVSSQNSEVYFENDGPTHEIIRGALALPGILKPHAWGGRERISAAFDKPYPVEKAKDLNVGKTICADVIASGVNYETKDDTEQRISILMKSSVSLAREELKNCDYIISVKADDVGFLDFEAKAKLIYKGKQAVKLWITQLKSQ